MTGIIGNVTFYHMTQQLTTIANTATGYKQMHRQIRETSGKLFYILSVIPDPLYASGFRIREFMGRTGVRKYWTRKGVSRLTRREVSLDERRNTIVSVTNGSKSLETFRTVKADRVAVLLCKDIYINKEIYYKALRIKQENDQQLSENIIQLINNHNLTNQ